MKMFFVLVFVAVFAFVFGVCWKWGANPFRAVMPDLTAGETRVTQGPPLLSVAKLNELVSLRVRIRRILSGQNSWYKGIWEIEGDAIIGTDCGRAESKDIDTVSKSFVLRLPQPRIIMSRVDHERTRLYDFRSHTWNPARFIWGDPDEIRDESMKQAQAKLEEDARSIDFIEQAKQQAEFNLSRLYSALGWNVTIEWISTADHMRSEVTQLNYQPPRYVDGASSPTSAQRL